MPTLRQSAFLPRALESLLAQTLTDWELIVVDDGSPDGTADVLAPFLADPRIHLLRLERNRGLGHALNVATREARGEYLASLPFDDVIYPDHLARLTANARAARHHFAFETHAPALVGLFREVVVRHREAVG